MKIEIIGKSEDVAEYFKEILNEKQPLIIAGPCAVEDFPMMDKITAYLKKMDVSIIRAGAFKPRTSPDTFQGLGIEGLKILDIIRKKYEVKILSEIVDLKYLDVMCENVDILQVGARNMQNFELLKELGKTNMPILLKRGMCATVNEFKCAAEYIQQGGNKNLMLCERGVRSFDDCTRNLLDLSCVAIIKRETGLPVLVDISHSLGRKDIATEMSKAALAAGADGIMVEVHNNPDKALSDANQQMSLLEFEQFYNKLNLLSANQGRVW
ncbi:bifunctional 3-deoxy-7-phosphoheptulonate synthase/chorismate mutase [Anaerosporobacter sp.]|uniref:bifunctional 3-deoxy-7-phosphoheptulonate synthase/chorismate mutase n=1 Tax=Anaerosporobacter sp. TaxID=1872529 RepID=UPI00289E3F4A|nr:bifunctional 3-deoxy-7-phosphoheptulonate synthase/chorismate mutase [Anaerosporobacter sp.]